MNGRRYFSITFLDQLPEQWTDWFDTPIRLETPNQNYILSGQVQDLAEFVGILCRFQLLNLDPVSMKYRVETEEGNLDQPSGTPSTPEV